MEMMDPTASADPTEQTEQEAAPAKKKKRKKKYSKGLKTFQELERGTSKAQRRLAQAVEAGFRTWSRRRDKSAAKRRDGAIKDGFTNAAFAFGSMARVASRAPEDFVRAMKPWRQLKRFEKMFS